MTARVSNDRPKVGEVVVVDVEATGFADRPPNLQGPQVDDEPYAWTSAACPPVDDGETPPPASPQSTRRTVSRSFDEPGRHRLVFRANDRCSYYVGAEEELVVTIDVQPAPPPASPAPPSPSPSASA